MGFTESLPLNYCGVGSFVHFTKKTFVVEYRCKTLFLTKGVFHYGYYNRFIEYSSRRCFTLPLLVLVYNRCVTE